MGKLICALALAMWMLLVFDREPLNLNAEVKTWVLPGMTLSDR